MATTPAAASSPPIAPPVVGRRASGRTARRRGRPRRARRRLAGGLLPRPARDHLRRQPRDEGRRGHVVLDHLGFQNYAQATRPEYLPAFANSLRYALITTILSIALGYPIAYWISRYGGQRKVLLLILVMLPFWTSYLIRTYAWMIILRDNGVLNGILRALGLIDEPLILLNTDLIVILGMTYGFLPFAILPLFVSIDRLDQNLVQAARDLYASGRGAFLHVTLPLTMPGIIAAALLTFIPAIGDYVTPDLLGGAQTTTAAKLVQIAVHERPRLAVRLGARVHPDDPDPRRDAARAALAAPGDVRVRPGGNRWLSGVRGR